MTRRLAHEPLGRPPTTLLVTIRRYRCTGCGHVWRQDTSRAAEPRAKRSRTARRWALVALVCQHRTVARLAEALAVSWDTANDAVLAEGERVLLDDPSRFDDVKAIGADEHVWRWDEPVELLVQASEPGVFCLGFDLPTKAVKNRAHEERRKFVAVEKLRELRVENARVLRHPNRGDFENFAGWFRWPAGSTTHLHYLLPDCCAVAFTAYGVWQVFLAEGSWRYSTVMCRRAAACPQPRAIGSAKRSTRQAFTDARATNASIALCGTRSCWPTRTAASSPFATRRLTAKIETPSWLATSARV